MRKVNFLVNELNNESIPVQVWNNLPLHVKGEIYVMTNLLALSYFILKRRNDIFHVHHNRVSYYVILLKLFFPNIIVVRSVHSQYKNLKRIQKYLWRFTSNRYSIIIYNSFSTKNSYTYKGNHVTIYNGIENEGLIGRKFRKIDICLIGRMVSVKNWDKIIEVLNIFSLKNSDLKIVFVGDGPLCESLKRQDKHGITFYGSLKHKEAMEVLSNSKVSLFGSEHEGFCNSLVECLFYGVLPICKEIPIFREVAGSSALYFQEWKDLLNVLEAINFSSIPEIRGPIDFTMDKHINSLLAIYKSL